MVITFPNNKLIENTVIGSLMSDEKALVNNIRFLEEDCFYDNTNKNIFKSIINLFKDNKSVDLMSVHAQLKKDGCDIEYRKLVDLATSTENYRITDKCLILKEYAIRRNLIISCNEISKKSFDESEDVLETLEESSKAIDNISMIVNVNQFNPIDRVLIESVKEIEEASTKDGVVRGVTSGFYDIDKITSGWSKSDLIIVAARPSMGKSSMARSFILNACMKQEANIAFFSLEESRAQIGKKFISAVSEVPYERIKLGNLNDKEWSKIHDAISQLENLDLTIDDTSGLSIFELKSKCRMLNHKKKLDMVVIDYLQLMRGEVKKNANREQEISYISRSLKGLAKDLNIPVIALAQLSRAVEIRSDKKPMLSDLRESGSLEQDADIVSFIYRPDYYGITEIDGQDITGQTKFIIAKHRSGELGEPKLQFQAQKAKFTEINLF
jgi:replicative DNA helicase